MTVDLDNDRDRLFKHFPMDGDLSMQLLKGHLALEQTLRELLDLYLWKPEGLRGDKGTSLDSHAVICLADSLTPKTFPHNWAFVAAKKLNQARNSLAHKIDEHIFRSQCADFVKFIKASDPAFTSAMEQEWNVPSESEFAACVSGLCSIFAHLKPYASTSKREV